MSLLSVRFEMETSLCQRAAMWCIELLWNSEIWSAVDDQLAKDDRLEVWCSFSHAFLLPFSLSFSRTVSGSPFHVNEKREIVYSREIRRLANCLFSSHSVFVILVKRQSRYCWFMSRKLAALLLLNSHTNSGPIRASKGNNLPQPQFENRGSALYVTRWIVAGGSEP